MTTGVTSTQLAGFAPLLYCARCRRRFRELTVGGVWRAYQCERGCRQQPVDAAWLEGQVQRALAGRVCLTRAAQAVTAITVAEAEPQGVRIRWRNYHPVGRQPDPTPRPATVFVPVRRRPA